MAHISSADDMGKPEFLDKSVFDMVRKHLEFGDEVRKMGW